jgi:hypothetical protein
MIQPVQSQNPLTVDIADGKQNDAAENETQNRAERAAAAEPVVDEDEPAGADHRAEGEGEVIVEA